MSEELSLFDAPPAEPEGEQPEVMGLVEHGEIQQGEWTEFWAVALFQLISRREREHVMRLRGHDPELYEIHRPRVFNKLEVGWRTWWYAKLKGAA